MMQKFDELISYFNRKVSEMEIGTSYKMELLGMVTALGYAHEKENEERKTGRWLPDNNNYYEERYICSACGKGYKVDTCMGEPLWHFCPNCGARMDGEADG